MALRKAAAAIQFAGGVSTKTDAKQVPVTQLIDLQNASFVRDTTLRKRNGYSALGRQIDDAAAQYENARGLARRDDELVLFTETSSLSYRPASDTWSDIGGVASVVASTTPIARAGAVQCAPDSITLSGITAAAWEDSRGGVWGTVIEQATGRVLAEPQQLDDSADAIHVRVVVTELVMHILWARRDSGRIYRATVDPASAGTIGAATILIDDLSTTLPFYDACIQRGTNIPGDFPTSLIAWVSTTGAYRLGFIAPSGVIGSPVTGYSSAFTSSDTLTGPLALACDYFGACAVVFPDGVINARFHDTTSNFATFRTANTLIGTGELVRITAAFGENDTTASTWQHLWWCAEMAGDESDLNHLRISKLLLDDAALDTAGASFLRGHCLASRAFRDGLQTTAADDITGDVYVAIVHAVKFFPYVAVIRMSDAEGITPSNAHDVPVVARLLPQESIGAMFRRVSSTMFEPVQHLPSITEVDISTDPLDISTRTHSIPLGYRIQLDSEDGDQFSETGIKVCSLDFDADASYQTAELGRGLYLAGACPAHYDGARWAEGDIHTAPDKGYTEDGIAIALSDSFSHIVDGGDVPNGTYLYRVWYEHMDAQGELHVGPVSTVEYEADGAERDTVEMVLPCYRLTAREHVRICVARSAVNQTGTIDTIPFYRVTGTDPAVQTGHNCYVENDPEADTVTFLDGLSDADLIKREPLYTNGGILSNDPAPWAGDVIAGGKGRLFWTDPTDPNVVRYTQEQRDETGMEAPIVLSVPVDPYGGRIVGIGIMDDALIILKETALYFIGGPGPLADGGFASPQAFTPAQLLTSDVGCSSASSIAQTPAGIVFQSSKGIYLLDRTRQARSIGDPVYAYKDQRISRATLLPDRHQVLFLTDDEDGRSLLWDYERNQWSTYTNHVGFDATVIAGIYHYLRADGRVFRETPGVYRDDNTHISMLIHTAWIKFAGYLQGWQRIHHAMFIGRYVSSHTLRVRFRIDYQEGYSVPINIDVDADYQPDNYGDGPYGDGPYGGDLDAGAVYQQRIHINKRCQAIAFEVRDVEDTDEYGAAFELSELLLTGGMLGPAFQPGANRSQ